MLAPAAEGAGGDGAVAAGGGAAAAAPVGGAIGGKLNEQLGDLCHGFLTRNFPSDSYMRIFISPELLHSLGDLESLVFLMK